MTKSSRRRLSRRARRQIGRALLRAYIAIEQLRLEVERLRAAAGRVT